MLPKVSVCVPVYNAGEYVGECLGSLVRQTLKGIEIICVDDGSTDDSPKILDAYAKKYRNIKVVHKENGGLGSARDAGVAKATGEYIGFLDADDVADREMYEKLYNLATKNRAEVAFCNLKLFPENVRTDKKIWFNPYEGEMTGEFLYRNTQPTNKIFARELFERLDAKFEKNDSVCITLMINAHGLVSTNEKMYFYRMRNGSMSRAFKLEDFIGTVEAMMKIRNEGAEQKKLAEYFDFLVEDAIIKTLAVAASQNNRTVYNKYRKMLSNYSYRKNKYIRKFLRREHGVLKYFAIVNILPRSFMVSKILLRGRF